MVTLRADEHRYLVTAQGRDEALVRQIPGCRFVASAGLVLPRQPGSILALDRLFGADGWSPQADLAIEISEARQRPVGGASAAATVTLQNNELAVECAFGDKELVKLVPGYRWSAPQRRWFLPASPMALDALREYFGEHLAVEEAAATYVELKRRDEQAALEKAARTAAARAEPAPTPTEPAQVSEQPAAWAGSREDGLAPLIERLSAAIGSLETTIARLAERLPEVVAAPPAEEAAAAATPAEAAPDLPSYGQAQWRDLLAEVEADPSAAGDRISSLLQLAGDDGLPPLRAVAGIAASLAGDHEAALSMLRKSEEQLSVALDPDLQRRVRASYLDSVLALINANCGPERPVASIAGLEELLLAELVHNSGFDDAALAGPESRNLLSFLMDDPHLRRHDRVLADYCRVLHLLCVARGGRWMAAERVVEMLRHRELTEDGFALGLVVLANTVFEQPCLDEWLLRWPPESSEIGTTDLEWITTEAVARLRAVEPTLGAESALAGLALIASGPVAVASTSDRRELVKLIPPKASSRRYAEFLAAFQLAAQGHRKVTQNFPGYLQVLANSPLSQSAGHLLNVFVNDSGGADSTTRHIAEEVFLEAVRTRGVRDPQTEVLDLLDMLAESPRADNLLNQLSEWVEDAAFRGSGAFSAGQRRSLFERTFRVALSKGHDVDTVRAFDRCAREFLRQGEIEGLRTLCMGVPQTFKPLQLPVGQALLSLQLEAGEDFQAAAEMVIRHSSPDIPGDEATLELRGLAMTFPRLWQFLSADERFGLEPVRPEEEAGLFEGKRLVVVGGHEWLRKHAMPHFDRWGVRTTWLDPEAAKQGSQALDLAGGEADVIVINTACISHAASGRVRAEAERSGMRYAFHNSRGVGALLSIARTSLADSQPPVVEAPPRASKVADLKKLMR